MKFLKITLIFLIISSFHAAVYAQNNDDPNELLRGYIKALKSKNRKATTAAWLKINENPQAVDYLRTEHPGAYRSYRTWGYVVESQKIKKRYFGETSIRESKISTPGKRRGTFSNRDTIKNTPNSSRRSNNQIVRDSPNSKRISNNDISRRSSNRDNISNQKRIKNSRRNRR